MTKRRRKYRGALLGVRFAVLIGSTAQCLGDVDLQWRPPIQTARVGEEVHVELYAVSDSAENQGISALAVISSWDPNRLELLGIDRTGEGYAWLRSFFPDDRRLDGINADCGPIEFCTPFSEHPFNDGLAYYEAWSNLSPPPAEATPSGLLVTKFRFRATHPGTARVQFMYIFGEFTTTRVLHGSVPGREITGNLGPPIEIRVATCAITPEVIAEGGRYFMVTPADLANQPIALFVEGDPSNNRVSCVSAYVQDNGSLGPEPFFQTAADWGTVHVWGAEIEPGTLYLVRSDCGTADSPELSAGAGVRTWTWGDVNNSGLSDTEDLTIVLDASQGVFGSATIENLDLAGCVPNGIIDTEDIVSALDASQGQAYSCPPVCTVTIGLADVAGFVGCFAGPGLYQSSRCIDFDSDHDADVDLKDLAPLVNRFGPPPNGP